MSPKAARKIADVGIDQVGWIDDHVSLVWRITSSSGQEGSVVLMDKVSKSCRRSRADARDAKHARGLLVLSRNLWVKPIIACVGEYVLTATDPPDIHGGLQSQDKVSIENFNSKQVSVSSI